jgi:hypothetical protein
MKKIDEVCNGKCTPDLCLYSARCPVHGAALLRLAFEQMAEPEDEPGVRVERSR